MTLDMGHPNIGHPRKPASAKCQMLGCPMSNVISALFRPGPMKFKILKILIVTTILSSAVNSAGAQNSIPDRTNVLRAAAEAVGMVRWADIGNGSTILPGIDVINTMEFEGSGTGIEYHAAVGYNPASMR